MNSERELQTIVKITNNAKLLNFKKILFSGTAQNNPAQLERENYRKMRFCFI